MITKQPVPWPYYAMLAVRPSIRLFVCLSVLFGYITQKWKIVEKLQSSNILL